MPPEHFVYLTAKVSDTYVFTLFEGLFLPGFLLCLKLLGKYFDRFGVSNASMMYQ